MGQKGQSIGESGEAEAAELAGWVRDSNGRKQPAVLISQEKEADSEKHTCSGNVPIHEH